MKRKFMLLLMISVLLITTFGGCGDNNTDTEPETTNGTQMPTFEFEETGDTLPNVDTLTLPEYNAMTAEQQHAIMNTFETTDDFFEWYNEKVQDYQEYVEQQKNPTEDTNNETTETTVPNVSVPPADKMTYVAYNAMSADEQLVFINSFESIDAFFVWYNAAEEEYNNNLIEIDGSTPIDLEEIIGSN